MLTPGPTIRAGLVGRLDFVLWRPPAMSTNRACPWEEEPAPSSLPLLPTAGLAITQGRSPGPSGLW